MTARRRPNTTPEPLRPSDETALPGMERVPRLLRLADVCDRTALGRSSIYQLMRDGEFPMSVKIGGHAVRWRAADIARWIEDLPATSNAPLTADGERSRGAQAHRVARLERVPSVRPPADDGMPR